MPQIITILPLTSIRISEIVDDGPLVLNEIRVAALVEKTPEEGISVQSPMSASQIDVDDIYENTDEHKTVIHDAESPPSNFVKASVSGTPVLRDSNDAEGSAGSTETLLLALTKPIPGNHLPGGTYRFTFEYKKTGTPSNRTYAIKNQFGVTIGGAQLSPTDEYTPITFDILITTPVGLIFSLYGTSGTGGTIYARNFHLLSTDTETLPGWP